MGDTSKVLQLHINKNQLEIDAFKKCVMSFTDMMEALLDEEAPFARWMLSVERGSIALNAELVADEGFDIERPFKVIEGHVKSMSFGQPSPKCPGKAVKEYAKLFKAVGLDESGKPGADIIAFDHGEATSKSPISAAPIITRETSTFKVIGSLTGMICKLESKNKRGDRFSIIDDATGRCIGGKISKRALESIRGTFKSHATVSGVLTYSNSGELLSIEARSVRVIPSEKPKLSDLCGILEA